MLMFPKTSGQLPNFPSFRASKTTSEPSSTANRALRARPSRLGSRSVRRDSTDCAAPHPSAALLVVERVPLAPAHVMPPWSRRPSVSISRRREQPQRGALASCQVWRQTWKEPSCKNSSTSGEERLPLTLCDRATSISTSPGLATSDSPFAHGRLTLACDRESPAFARSHPSPVRGWISAT
jgi:hypothetical protein